VASAVAHQTHAVEEDIIHVAAVEAPQRDGVEARCTAAKVGVDPRRIAQRLVNVHHALIVHLLTGDNRYRLTGDNQRLIGFGGAARALHRVALGRRSGRLGGGSANDNGIFSQNGMGKGNAQRAKPDRAF